MSNINAFTGVGSDVLAGVLATGMSRTLHAAPAAVVAAAHPAFVPNDGWAAAAIPTQRKRRAAAATGASVDRGIT